MSLRETWLSVVKKLRWWGVWWGASCIIFHAEADYFTDFSGRFRTADLKNYIFIEQQVDDTVRGNEKVNPLESDRKRNTFWDPNSSIDTHYSRFNIMEPEKQSNPTKCKVTCFFLVVVVVHVSIQSPNITLQGSNLVMLLVFNKVYTPQQFPQYLPGPSLFWGIGIGYVLGRFQIWDHLCGPSPGRQIHR